MKKTFAILILLIAVLQLSAQEQIAVTIPPYLQDITENEATIVWETNLPGIGWVETAPDDGTHFYASERPKYYDSALGIKTVGTLHKVTITGLSPDTRYRYRVFTREVTSRQGSKAYYGNVASTQVYKVTPLSFTTAKADVGGFKFVVMNDIHGNGELFNDLIGTEDMETVDFYIFNGDMVSSMNEKNTIADGFLKYASPALSSGKSGKHFYMNRGNHETRGIYAPDFLKYFKTPGGKVYYTFIYGDVFFLILDSGEDKPDNDIEYYGLADFDSYRENEKEWLEKVVTSVDFKSAKYRIALMHMPPVGERGWHGPNEVKRLFLPVLNEAGIDLMLCGHTHNYAFHPANSEGNKFPIIINDNETAASVSISDTGITVSIKDRSGKIIHLKEFPVQDNTSALNTGQGS